MRHFIEGLCAIATLVIAGGCAAAAANSDLPLAHKAGVTAPAQSASLACLGGVLNEQPTGSYLTVADYPGFAAFTAGLRRIFICGDSIPPILPSGERVGSTSRRR